MSRSDNIAFVPSETPIATPTSKFGGQPVWLDEPQWPLSAANGNPMQFICQIALDDSLFPGCAGKVAYLFMTGDDDDEAETWEPDGGDNAVIIQPGGTLHVPVAPLRHGPALFAMIEEDGEEYLIPAPHEYELALTRADEPAFVPESARDGWSEDEQNEYVDKLAGNKIGGSPCFLQYDEFPSGDDEWQLLLQLDSTEVPFYINFGDAGVAYAFINKDGTLGKMLWQCA